MFNMKYLGTDENAPCTSCLGCVEVMEVHIGKEAALPVGAIGSHSGQLASGYTTIRLCAECVRKIGRAFVEMTA